MPNLGGRGEKDTGQSLHSDVGIHNLIHDVLLLGCRCAVLERPGIDDAAAVLDEFAPELAAIARDPPLVKGRRASFSGWGPPSGVRARTTQDSPPRALKSAAWSSWAAPPSPWSTASGRRRSGRSAERRARRSVDISLGDDQRADQVEVGAGSWIPSLPTMVVTALRPDLSALVCNRGARHCYPSLLTSEAWRPWLAGPLVRRTGRRRQAVASPLHWADWFADVVKIGAGCDRHGRSIGRIAGRATSSS